MAMSLPPDLTQQLIAVCKSRGIDPTDPMRILDALVAGAPCIAHHLWGGPAFGQESLEVDVYVLVDRCLCNMAVYPGGKISTSVQFLDVINSVILIRVDDVRSP